MKLCSIPLHRSPVGCGVIGLLVLHLVLGNDSLAQSFADFDIQPSAIIKVHQEVLLDGSKSVYGTGKIPTKMLWDFGDGMSSGPSLGGITVTHVYSRPGQYHITLSVSYTDGVSDSISKTIQVQGDFPRLAPRAPRENLALEVKFDGQLSDSSPNSCELQWITPGAFVSGIENQSADLAGGSHLKISSHPAIDTFSNGITISFWARRNAPGSNGYLLYKPGLISAFTSLSGTETIFRCYLYSGQNSVLVQNFFAPSDVGWHHYAIRYDNVSVSLYIDGFLREEAGKNPMPFTGILGNAASDLYIGAKNDGALSWNGLMDEVKIFNRALDEDELFRGFESEHADFHCRIGQYIDYHIPSDVTSAPQNRLKVTLSRTGLSQVLCDRNSLKTFERLLFRPGTLNRGDYTVTSQLVDTAGAIIEQFVEYFSKPYDGSPKVGIDENNSILLNGKLVFPVTSWGLNNADIASWVRQPDARINSLYLQGFWPVNLTPDGWENYLNAGYQYSTPSIGPGSWEGKSIPNVPYSERYANGAIIAQYITQNKNHPGMFMWMWDDEPDLGGYTQIVPAEVIRSWTWASHQLDSQHPVSTNLCGKTWAEESNLASRFKRWMYSYEGNKKIFGRKTYVADVLGFDYYPIDWKNLYNASISKLALGLDKIQEENPHIPIMSFVETADIRDDTFNKYRNRNVYAEMTPTPTAVQIKMLAWLHVVHGIKGINWFHFFADRENLDNISAMSDFCRQITDLTPVVLSSKITSSITVEPEQGRVDSMVKAYNGSLYLFAVRLTEVDETVSNPKVRITIPEIESLKAIVLYENRELHTANHSFTDNFHANDVHIYKIDNQNLVPVTEILDEMIFDNILDYRTVSTTDWDPLSTGVSLWFNSADGFTSNQYIFGHTVNLGNRIELYAVNGNLCLGLGDNHAVKSNIQTLQANTWYNIALVWNHGTYTVYVNGLQKATGVYTGLTQLNTFADLGNTGNPATRNQGFLGTLDDIRIYNRALSAVEIRDVYLTSDGRENWLSQVNLPPYDLAGNPISFSSIVTGLPKRAAFNPGTNALSWRPWYDQAGSYELLFSAIDSDYTQKVTIDVENVLLKNWYQDWLANDTVLEAMVEY